MAFLVSFADIGVAGIGILGVAAPGQLVDLLARWRVFTGLPVTLALRLRLVENFSCVFAPACRWLTYCPLSDVRLCTAVRHSQFADKAGLDGGQGTDALSLSTGSFSVPPAIQGFEQ